MGLSRKDIAGILKPLRLKAEESFPHIRMNFIYLYEDEIEGVRVDLPRGLTMQEFDRIRPDDENPAFIRCLGIQTNRTFNLFNMMNWRKNMALFLVDLRHTLSRSDMQLAFWRAFSTAMDLGAYLNMLASKKQDLPDFISEQDFEKSAQSSLRTDLFAALTMALEANSISALHSVFRARAEAPFHRSHMNGCEDHPCIVSYDAALFGYESTIETLDHYNPCKTARRLAIDIVKGFDKNAYDGWRDFALPARDMSLRGYPIPTILSGALCVSDKPHIRSVAHNCAILLDCEAVLDQPEELEYNAFDSDQSNLIKHEQYAKKLFEKALYEAKKRSCSAPLHEEANRQNLRLTQGRITGWCADILQQAAEEFDTIFAENPEFHMDELPKPADFEKSSHAHYQQWSGLRHICDLVLDRKLKGETTSLAQLSGMDSESGDTSGVQDSIRTTMTNAAYLNKLETANKRTFRPTPDFKINTPQMAPKTPSTPQPVPVPTPFGTEMQIPASAKTDDSSDTR